MAHISQHWATSTSAASRLEYADSPLDVSFHPESFIIRKDINRLIKSQQWSWADSWRRECDQTDPYQSARLVHLYMLCSSMPKISDFSHKCPCSQKVRSCIVVKFNHIRLVFVLLMTMSFLNAVAFTFRVILTSYYSV